jgi:RND family efflux transporter MFP subunit
MDGSMIRSLAAVAVLVALALLVGFVLGAGSFATEPPPTRPPATATPRPTPSPTPIDLSVVASAVVVPTRSADLAMTTAGRVAAVLVEAEDDVAAGDVLLRLDSSAQQAAVSFASADVRRAEAAVQRARAQLELVPEDAPPAERESAEAEVRLAQAELELARSALAEAEVALAQTELRAPFDATVVSVDIAAGEQADVGQRVLTVADTSAWFIETTDLGELDVVRISVGDRATITFEALPNVELGGEVARIQVRGTTQQVGVRFGVIIRPDTHLAELRWNMSATVRILPGG